MICVGYSILTKNQMLLYRKYEDQLPRPMLERYRRFHRLEDAGTYLAGKIMLKEMLVENGIKESLGDIIYNRYGKPILDEVYFNISHSRNAVVCALSESVVGIDIEFKAQVQINDFEEVFSDYERKAIGSDLNLFYELWTQKEAVAKADGRGFSMRPSDITIENNIGKADCQSWYLHQLFISSEYSCYVAAKEKTQEIIVRRRDSNFNA